MLRKPRLKINTQVGDNFFEIKTRQDNPSAGTTIGIKHNLFEFDSDETIHGEIRGELQTHYYRPNIVFNFNVGIGYPL